MVKGEETLCLANKTTQFLSRDCLHRAQRGKRFATILGTPRKQDLLRYTFAVIFFRCYLLPDKNNFYFMLSTAKTRRSPLVSYAGLNGKLRRPHLNLTLKLRNYRVFSYNLSSTFIYYWILIKISMNASIMKMHIFCKKIIDLKGHQRSQKVKIVSRIHLAAVTI